MPSRDMSSTSTDANRHFWRLRSAVREYQNQQGWLDDGERVAIEAVASELRGLPLLDIGVGGGRTTSLLRLLTDDYVGVDWSPEMVEVCRSNHPGADISQADARDLSAFASSTFKCVVFSFNGLDSIADHEERARRRRSPPSPAARRHLCLLDALDPRALFPPTPVAPRTLAIRRQGGLVVRIASQA